MARARVIRDPIYGYVHLPAALVDVVDDPMYQRLRRIGQTSLTLLVYPSASGTRFEHGLGTMYLAMRGWRAAWMNAKDKTRQEFKIAVTRSVKIPKDTDFADAIEASIGCVGLLHDVGHPPFSHVLESVFSHRIEDVLGHEPDLIDRWESFGGEFHEFAGEVISRRLFKKLNAPLDELARRIYESDSDGVGWDECLHSVVASEIDVDRMDYVMRDARKAGTEFGSVDYERLIDALELHVSAEGFQIAPGIRARSAVETLLVQRSQSYKWITFHHRVVGANLALTRACELYWLLTKNDEPLTGDEHPTTLGTVFRDASATLNYVSPTSEDVALASGRILSPNSVDAIPPPESPQLPLDQDVQARLWEDLEVEVQAGVDDGTIIEMLKKASLSARALLGLGTLDLGTSQMLGDFVTYVSAALFREKNVLPAWKTVEEFYGAARRMRAALLMAIDDSIGEVVSGLPQSSDLRATFDERREQLTRALSRDAVEGVNELFQELLRRPQYRVALCGVLHELRPSLKGVAGFWDVAYTSFKPVRTGANLSVLYERDNALPLRDNSPLVDALATVEARRNKAFIYFFVRFGASSEGARGTVRESREMLTGDVIDGFPKFVRSFLGQSLIDSVHSA